MRPAVLSGICLALAALPVAAQTVIGAKSGVINWVEGDVFLADKPYVMQPSQFGEVKENMVLRTEEGRAEVLLPPGVFFRLGDAASFKMISNRLIDTRVELLTGSGVIEIDDIEKDAAVTVVLKDASVSLAKAGLYRFDTNPAQIKVFKGGADVTINGQTIPVAAGKMLSVGAVAAVEKFDTALTDPLDRWSHRRAEVVANANVSAAKQAHYGGGGSGYGGGLYGIGGNPCRGYGGYNTGPMVRPLMGTWGYNPYYGFGTYIPCNGTMNSPYGYRYYSPLAAYQAFYAPRPTMSSPSPNFGSFGSPGYRTMGGSSGGYSGTMSSGPSVSSSAPAAVSSGSSAASSAGSASVGGGSAGGGGRGK